MNNKLKGILLHIKKAIKKTLGIKKIIKVGADKKLNKVNDLPHSQIFPSATYSPWKNSEAFKKVYNIARNYTLVDEYRLYELYQLASQAVHLKGDFLEVGVWRGGSSAIIQTALCDNNTDADFYIADTFQGVAKAGSIKDTGYQGGEHADASLKDVKELFTKIGRGTPEILVGIFPDDHNELEIERLAFVHSDVDAYESTKGVVEWCIPKMVKGGVIVFDDYGFAGCEGVTRYVNEIISKSEFKEHFLFVHNLNGHAILFKK